VTAIRPMSKLLFLASTNQGKLREFRLAAAESGIVVQPVPAMSDLPPCIEDGLTFEANARKKALYYASHAHGAVFADDSGICVDALGGAPGVHSARYSGPDATDESNNQKLISDLCHQGEGGEAASGLRIPIAYPPFSGFPAHYACVIALAAGEQILGVVEGCCDGVIIDTPRGEGGFGYDPYFFYPPLNRTFGELNGEEKFLVSHRGIAFRKLLKFLATERECRLVP
jgi:XTP/dITP diphosphohydrolase